jgi:uncharacterized membrane protein
MRTLRMIVAAIAMVFGVTLLIFLAALLIAGPSVADRVWSSPYLIALYPAAIFVAVRYLR